MSSEELAKDLHNKSTRGQHLTPEEHILLNNWYSQQDQEEIKTLGQAAQPGNVSELRHQVDVALGQLVKVSLRIQDLSQTNEVLQQEIQELQQRLQKNQSQTA
jgi:transcriptional regulator with AAA-type ATPase domain